MRKELGSITVEGAFIYSFVVLLIAALLQLDFRLHDEAISASCVAMAGLRCEQTKHYFFDAEGKNMNLNRLLSEPVLGETEEENPMIAEIREREKYYYEGHRIISRHELSRDDPADRITAGKNANILRAGTRVVQLIGEEESAE